MKQRFLILTALLCMVAVLLAACQKNTNTDTDNTPKIAEYKGYSTIPDFGDLSGLTPDEDLAKDAAERLCVDEDMVKVYHLTDETKADVKTWVKELKNRGFSPADDLKVTGNTVKYYNEDKKLGLVAGYMDTDKEEGADALAILLVSKADKGTYVDIDFEEVQNLWSNQNNGGSFVIDEKKIYGYGYIGSSQDGFLSKNTDSSNAVMLVEDVAPQFMTEYNNVVYACLPALSGEEKGRLITYNTKEKDVEEAITTLKEGDFNSLQIYNDHLYYTTEDGLFLADLDGENAKKLSAKEMQNTYIVGDKVYYKDKSDEGTEHSLSLLTLADTRLTEEEADSFFLGSKGYGYYLTERELPEEEPAEDSGEDGEEAEDQEASTDEDESTEEEDLPATEWVLVKVALKDGETTDLATAQESTALLGIGSRVYFVSEEHEGQVYSVSKQGGTPKRVTRDKDCRNLMTFHEMILYYDYEDETDEGLEHIYVSTTDGFMKSDILR